MEKIKIHSYKHDQSLHRVWLNIVPLEIANKRIVVANQQSKVIEGSGGVWFTKEPAICFFFEDEWYNVIAMLKETGVEYYCNISSPAVIDSEAIKYIDYDLDVRMDRNKKINILDRTEYKNHAEKMGYDEDTKFIIEKTLEELVKKIEAKEFPFQDEVIESYYRIFKKLQPKVKCKLFD